MEKLPACEHRVPITIRGSNKSRVKVMGVIRNPLLSKKVVENCFIESNGYVSIQAEHYTRAINSHFISWQRIPELGRTLSEMTPFPVTAPAQSPGGDSPRLEYDCYPFITGEVTVKAYLSSTLDFHNNQGLLYGISFDDEPVKIINMHENKIFQDWEESVRNNVTVEMSKHIITEPGKHVLKYWTVDPDVVRQNLIVETSEVKSCYLGLSENFNCAIKKTDRKNL